MRGAAQDVTTQMDGTTMALTTADSTIEATYNVLSHDVTYRLRHNPDAAPGDDSGVVIDWTDDDGKTYNGHCFIARDAVRPVARVLLLLKDEVS